MPTARFVAMSHYLLGPVLTLCLWVCLLMLPWNTDGGGGAVAAAFVVALILTLPAAFCVGLVRRLVECVYDWWRDYRRCR